MFEEFAFGVEKLNFSLDLAFILACTFFWEGIARVAEVRAFSVRIAL